MDAEGSGSERTPRVVGRPFPKGVSGNPGGMVKGYAEIRELAREHTEMALRTLANIAKSKKFPPAARVSAAQALLDRGYGKPSQPVEGADGEPLRVSIAIDLGGK